MSTMQTMFDVKPFIQLLVLSVAFPGFGQTAPRTQERSVERFENRIASLDHKFEDVTDSTQKQLDAAGCPGNGRIDVCRRVADDMMTAMNAIAADIHAEVDSFIRVAAASAPNQALDGTAVSNQLRRILPKGTDEAPSVFVGGAPDRRHLIAAYCLHKGTLMGSNGTSVTVRAYNQTANGMALTDVTGDDMNGFGRLVVKALRPRVADPADSRTPATCLLLSGYMTGANGPLNRMRLYVYDGRQFHPVWMPEDVWGEFTVKATANGFTVEGDYYRENRRRRDAYAVAETGVQLIAREAR